MTQWLIRIVNNAFGLLYLLLLLRFFVLSVFGSLSGNASLPSFLLPVWMVLVQVTDFLLLPLLALTQAVYKSFPESVYAWFPTAKVSLLMKTVLGWLYGLPGLDMLPAATAHATKNYDVDFPGIADWLSLMAIPLWLVLHITLVWTLNLLTDTTEAASDDESTDEKSHHSRTKQSSRVKQKVYQRKPPLFQRLFPWLTKQPRPETSASSPKPAQTSNSDSETLTKTPKPPSELRNRLKKTAPPRQPITELPAAWQETLETHVTEATESTSQQQAWEAQWREQEALLQNKVREQRKENTARNLLQDLQIENRQLQESREQLRSTVAQYFSPAVFRYLEQNRETFEKMDNHKQDVTVLFCDIRGFTTFSQSHSTKEVTELLDEYFSVVNDIILNRFNGSIAKLMGDGVMAYWGFPLPNPDHAFVATQAAITIIKTIESRGFGRFNLSGKDSGIGAGLSSGEVFVGNVGSKDFKDFTLIGNPVNLASRIEHMNVDLDTKLLVSEETYRAFQGRLPCKQHANLSIRGFSGQFNLYEPEWD
ncbi:MAG: adenylate/guanylate cyclase domain-containing protein [Candidatus Melainabacteria bacterium]|nr:adenylate/guanylate cyclase domain-containing protein [Candidatus Melainabacteria bacterium]